ncbi:disease resistance protein Pik-2-like [Lolium rigidum]|uniref:disease resistance protein Pik-2-like n=1 Tax=Lolium rigidum TaxID=89674 RepID=UPI001F5CCBD0|nr:disease resistance protein Pik-2-like [Lolium rigidum]
MEATAVSLGKAVLDGALGYAKSKAAEEIALQLDVERDVDFITDELQMMQSFLEMADEDNGQNKVFMTWVKQIRDLAYKVEDSLMDFGLHSEKKPLWGCIPCNLSDRRQIAKEVKELRAKVEDVSNRNLRYRLIKDRKDNSDSKATAAEKQANIASAAMLGINEATLATQEQEKTEVNLHQLITSEEEDLRVIALWGTSGDHGKTSAIQELYDDPKVLKKFGLCAWVRLMYPFNPQEFLRSLVRQFYEKSHDEVGKQESITNVGANSFAKMEKMDQSDLISVFSAQLHSNSYLIVINDLSTIEEWHCIKKYFPNNKKQSRIIVSTQNVEIASLCTEKPYQVSELRQLSCDQTIYLFHKKNTKENSMSSASMVMFPTNEARLTNVEEKLKAVHEGMPTNEIQQEDERPKPAGGNKVFNSTATKKFNRSSTLALVDGVLTGRETEKSNVIKLIGQPDNNQSCKVISVWGMGGLGKTTLVRSIYRSQELSVWKHAWVTALRPFNPEVLLRDLALQLQKSIQEDTAGATSTKGISLMKIQELKVELARLLKTQNCLIVLDDISSIYEWDLVKGCLDSAGRIIITTRERNIAEHCSTVCKNMYSLEGLKGGAALDLFTKKVFKDNTEKVDLAPAMMEQAQIILKKCDGLPLAISTIGGFLATKPKTAVEWRMMNDRISAELEINPELRTIKTVLIRSYDGLPYYLKSAFLYLSIFQEDQVIRLDRLVRRWIAEGYSRDIHGITAEQLGHRYFEELLDRSMILPGEDVNDYNGKINSCQLHDIIREICISKAREENLVFKLEDGCCLSSTQGPIRHLVIGSNWKRDGDALPGVLDLSHVRSLTVFGDWRPFFISENMRFLRVLDLEDTLGLRDHHLNRVGQLHHLKYLSLRGCFNIFCLPHSLGNLGHLQTLDIRGTRICELPTTITNLGKLQNLRAPDCTTGDDNLHGAKVPRGIGHLKALHKLDGAYVKGNATVKEFRELTELRKLGVVGISSKNSMEFWSAIADHYHLRSLSVTCSSSADELDGCVCEGLSPPSWLESLKLYGKLVRVTDWIHQLPNLCKLVLGDSFLEQDDAIRALGVLPNLAVLRLKNYSFLGEQLHFQNSAFPSLVVLELYFLLNLESVLFEKDAMPRLELLQVGTCDELKEISGLSVLTSLKEIRLGAFVKSLKPQMLSQLGERQKHVIVKDL